MTAIIGQLSDEPIINILERKIGRDGMYHLTKHEFDKVISELKRLTKEVNGEFVDKSGDKWLDYTDENLTELGVEVIAFNPNWFHPDFNVKATRIGFQNIAKNMTEGQFVSAFWCDGCDEYHTDSNSRPTKFKFICS